MRKILTIITIFILCLSGVSAAVSPDFTISDPESKTTESLFIFSSSPDRSEATKGELINGKYTIVWSKESYDNAFEIYFSTPNRLGTQFVKNVYYHKPISKGTKLVLNVNNIDTGQLPNAWCNTDILLGALHFVCKDPNGCSPLSGGADFGWEIDSNHNGEIEAYGSSFRLVCPEVQDKCISKAGSAVTGDKICYANDVARWIYSGTTDVSGTCEEKIDFVERCGTNVCADGVCKSRSSEEKLNDGQSCLKDEVCKSGNCIINKCSSVTREDGETCIQINDCSSNVCKANKCGEIPELVTGDICSDSRGCNCNSGTIKYQESCKTETNAAGEVGAGSPSLLGQDCEADIFCDNGDILVPCIEGTYGTELTCSGNGNEGFVYEESVSDICKGKTYVNGECKGNGIFIIISIFIMLILIGLALFTTRQGKKIVKRVKK